jgi:hypothetical protein
VLLETMRAQVLETERAQLLLETERATVNCCPKNRVLSCSSWAS